MDSKKRFRLKFDSESAQRSVSGRYFKLKFDSESEQSFKVKMTEIVKSNVPTYEGKYEVTPTYEEQVLLTSDKQMKENVKVEAIGVSKVTNSSGGYTVIIGGI